MRQSRSIHMKKIFFVFVASALTCLSFGAKPITPEVKPVTYNSFEEILRTIDPTILPHQPASEEFSSGSTNDQFGNTNYVEVLSQKAAIVRSYVAGKYYEDLSELRDIDVIALAVVMVPFESRGNMQRVSYQQAFDCMMTAIGVATGISSLYALFSEGAAVSTILGTLKNIIRISGGWFMVGYGVYSFGSCVGWW